MNKPNKYLVYGFLIALGYVAVGYSGDEIVLPEEANGWRLGSTIAGSPDTLALVWRSFGTADMTLSGALSFLER